MGGLFSSWCWKYNPQSPYLRFESADHDFLSENLAITALASQLEEYHNLVNLRVLNLKDEQIQKLSVENKALNQKLTESLKNINLKDEQVQKLSVENEGLQLEIVGYTSSTSWKITRPLRRFSRLVRRK